MGCYPPAEAFRFLSFRKKAHGQLPRRLVFDATLTPCANLAKLGLMQVSFITLRRRSPSLLREIHPLPLTSWRPVVLDAPTRFYRTSRTFKQLVRTAGSALRQIFFADLGREEPKILITNQHETAVETLMVRHAHRMLIENSLGDSVRFFPMNALSSAAGLKVDFDMALLIVASGLYRLVARRLRGHAEARARQTFRDLPDPPSPGRVHSRRGPRRV